MRCLSYRLKKIHRKFTSAYLLCDKASLSTKKIQINRSPKGSENERLLKKLDVFFLTCFELLKSRLSNNELVFAKKA